MKTLVTASIAALSFALLSACGSDFTPKNEVNGVRILAAKADQPYVRPGESVRIQLLAHDGRIDLQPSRCGSSGSPFHA